MLSPKRGLVETYCPREQHRAQWNVTQFANEILNQFGFDLKTAGIDIAAVLNHDELANSLVEKVKQRYEEKEALFGAQTLRWLERHILRSDIVDGQWKDHLLTLGPPEKGDWATRLRSEEDPLVEFQEGSIHSLRRPDGANRHGRSVRFLFLVRPAEQQPQPAVAATPRQPLAPGAVSRGRRCDPSFFAGPADRATPESASSRNLQFQAGPAQAEAPKPVRAGAKVGRNRPMPVRIGKKYRSATGQNRISTCLSKVA